MFKKTLILLFTFTLVIGLCACGEQKTPTGSATPTIALTPIPTAKPALTPAAKTPVPTTTPASKGNIKDVKGFVVDNAQSFDVELDLWGKVRFVSGKLTGGAHVPVEFYLTKENGDILYQFGAVLPYSVDVKAVSFEDLNGDGKRDITVIVSGGSADPNVAVVYFQKADGTFANDTKLDMEINDGGKNKDVRMIADYVIAKHK